VFHSPPAIGKACKGQPIPLHIRGGKATPPTSLLSYTTEQADQLELLAVLRGNTAPAHPPAGTMARITEEDQFPAHVDIQRKGDDILLPGRLIKPPPCPMAAPCKTVRDGAVGRFTRNGDGTTVLKLRWRSKWWEVPTMEQVQAWTLDSVCETPDGDIIEPDADGSWLRLLNLV
jgi:hypothetical protein